MYEYFLALLSSDRVFEKDRLISQKRLLDITLRMKSNKMSRKKESLAELEARPRGWTAPTVVVSAPSCRLKKIMMSRVLVEPTGELRSLFQSIS